MKNELKTFFTALAFLTRIPCYNLADFSDGYFSRAARYFPLVGLIVGGIGAFIYILSSIVLPNSLAVLLSIAATILVTGAFHEDGFGDSCDGLGGGNSKEQILTIMKDSRVGTYGVIGIVMMLLTKFFSLHELMPIMIPFTMIAGHSLSRFMSVTFIATHVYARDAETGKIKSGAREIGCKSLIIAAIFGILPMFLLGFKFFLVLIPLFITRQIISRELNKRLGGYTGDCLGGIQQITEACFYLSVLVISG